MLSRTNEQYSHNQSKFPLRAALVRKSYKTLSCADFSSSLMPIRRIIKFAREQYESVQKRLSPEKSETEAAAETTEQPAVDAEPAPEEPAPALEAK